MRNFLILVFVIYASLQVKENFTYRLNKFEKGQKLYLVAVDTLGGDEPWGVKRVYEKSTGKDIIWLDSDSYLKCRIVKQYETLP